MIISIGSVLVLAAAVGLIMHFTGGNRAAEMPVSDRPAGSTASVDAPDCRGTQGLLKASPVALNELSTIIPMGNFAPPGHIAPTPHMYFNFLNTGTPTNVVPAKTTIHAPGDITITQITLFDNGSAINPFNSYRIDFTVCKQVTGYFIHVVDLSDKLNAAMQPPYDHTQTSKISGSKDEHTYTKNVNIRLAAGEAIGTSGGSADRPYGVDFGFVDNRLQIPALANPARWTYDSHYACSLDYFPADLSAELYKHIGNYSYQYVDPGAPKCGTVYQDVPGTAQGIWFTRDVPTNTLGDPGMEIALVHSNFNHAQGVFSLGHQIQAVLGVDTNTTYLFTPAVTGYLNVDFNKVKPDGHVYCYMLKNPSNYSAPEATLLLLMSDATTLRVGTTGTSSCAGVTSMGSTYVEYIR